MTPASMKTAKGEKLEKISRFEKKEKKLQFVKTKKNQKKPNQLPQANVFIITTPSLYFSFYKPPHLHIAYSTVSLLSVMNHNYDF